MRKTENEKKEMAYNAYMKSMGDIPKSEIARQFGIPSSTVRSWAKRGAWNSVVNSLKYGNTEEAIPDEITLLLPKKTADIINKIQSSSAEDILWQNILLQYAAIIRAQRIMEVDETNILKTEKREIENAETSATEWENYTPWERYKIFMDTQSKAMMALTAMLKKFEEYKRNGLANEELCAKIELIKNKTEVLAANSDNNSIINVVSNVKRYNTDMSYEPNDDFDK